MGELVGVLGLRSPLKLMVSKEHFKVRKGSKGESLKVDELLANKGQFTEDASGFINTGAFKNKHDP